MARTQVFIRDGDTVSLWKTDLTGHGPVCVGEEFRAREMTQFGRPRLVKDGRRRRVRVVAILTGGTNPELLVEDLDSSGSGRQMALDL